MKRMKIVTAALLTCCLALGTVAMAGGTKKDAAMKGSASSDAMMEAMMKVASPGEYHNYLKPLAGTWKTTVKFWTAPDQMQISEGECESAWVMGGRYLKEECTGNFGGQPFNGMGLTGYDNMTKKYVSSWIDNMGTGIVMSEGSVDAAHKLFTFHSMVNDPMTGKPGKVKMVSKVVDDNRHVFSYYGDQGGKEMLQMEITYLRK